MGSSVSTPVYLVVDDIRRTRRHLFHTYFDHVERVPFKGIQIRPHDQPIVIAVGDGTTIYAWTEPATANYKEFNFMSQMRTAMISADLKTAPAVVSMPQLDTSAEVKAVLPGELVNGILRNDKSNTPTSASPVVIFPNPNYGGTPRFLAATADFVPATIGSIKVLSDYQAIVELKDGVRSFTVTSALPVKTGSIDLPVFQGGAYTQIKITKNK